MSYILDALNKSEQERQQREHGVSLQPLTGVPHPGNGTARWLPLAAGAFLVATVGIFAAVYFIMKAKIPPAQSAQTAPVAAAPVARSAPTPAPASAAPPVSKPAIAASAPSVATAPAVVDDQSAAAASSGTARAGTSESVKSLYQRKGMAAQQAKAEAAAEDSHSAPIADSTASDDVVKSGAAVKTFDADKMASVQTQDAARQSAPPPAEKSTVNQKALDAELAREREATRDAELAARVQAELERMQAQDAKAAEKQATAVAKAQPAQAKSKPVQPVSEPKQTASAAPAADPDANVPLATQLPADVQKRIPNINFDAHVYAGRTNAGFVILNDKKRYPGDTIAAGLTVDRITEDGVILNLSGTRFKLNSMSSWIN